MGSHNEACVGVEASGGLSRRVLLVLVGVVSLLLVFDLDRRLSLAATALRKDFLGRRSLVGANVVDEDEIMSSIMPLAKVLSMSL